MNKHDPTIPCSVYGCWRLPIRKALCGRHYHRMRRHGDPSGGRPSPSGTGYVWHGYKMLSVRGRKVAEHRLVMERHVGRKLLWNEHVHHVNENKLDNRLENLVITDPGEHHRVHHFRRFRSPTHKQCIRCMEIKPRSAFSRKYHKHKNSDPHSSDCMRCNNDVYRHGLPKKLPVSQSGWK